MKIGLNDWNYQVLMLVQAGIGSISQNFRMISLENDGGEWLIKFYLEDNVQEDLEEIEGMICQYTAYQDEELKCRYEIIVGSGVLPRSGSVRLVYRRREVSDS